MVTYLRAVWFLVAAICLAVFFALAVQNVLNNVSVKPWRPLW